MSLVSSITALATRVGAEIKLHRSRQYTHVYQILASELINYTNGAADSVRIPALANNNAVVKAAIVANPTALVKLPSGTAWPLSLELNGFTDSAFLPATPVNLEGHVKQAAGSWTDAENTTFKSNGTVPGSKVNCAPVVKIVRPFGAPVTVSSASIMKWGSPVPVPTNTFAQEATVLKVASYAGYQADDLLHFVSNDGYAWSSAAGYDAPAQVWKGTFVVLAGQGVTIGSYSRSAMNTAAGVAYTTLETRTLKGATSLVQGVVQGDDLYTSKVIFSSLTGAGNFTVGENLIDVETGAVVGTVADQYLITTSVLNTTYDTTPMFRKVTRASRQVNLKLVVDTDASPDDFILAYNREAAVVLTGVTDFKVDADIRGGLQRGVAVSSCYRGEVKAWVRGLPNHALEGFTERYQNAYGYGVGFFGSTEGVQAYVNAEHVRHGISTNGVGGSWNLDERTGLKTSATNCTNYHKYGTVRNNRFSADTRFTFAAGIDTHEGCENNIIENFSVVDPFFAARAVSNGAGISNRGFGTIIRNGRIRNCFYGIIDTGVTLDSGGLVYVNRVQNVVVENFWAYGYFQGNNAFSLAQSRIVLENCTFRGDPTVDSTNDWGIQAGAYLQSAVTETRNCKFETIYGSHIVHATGGRHTHIAPVFDFTGDVGTSGIRVQALMPSMTVINPHYKVGGALRPQSFFRSAAGATKFRVHGLTWEFVGTNTTLPTDITNDSGSTATIEIIAWATEKAAYAGSAGTDGKSAYELAVLGGYSGTQAAWIASLKGADGVTPAPEKGLLVLGPTGSGAATICDGVADDVQIQAAVNALAAADGGIIRLLTGVYDIRATVTVPKNSRVRIEGQYTTKSGFGGTTLQAGVSGLAALISESGTFPAVTSNADLSHVSHYDRLIFDGQGTTTAGLVLLNTDHTIVSNCKFVGVTIGIDGQYNGTVASSDYAGGLRVQASSFLATSIGIQLDSHTQDWITDSWFLGSPTTHIAFKSSNKIHLSNNEFNSVSGQIFTFTDTAALFCGDINVTGGFMNAGAGKPFWTDTRTNAASKGVIVAGVRMVQGVKTKLVGQAKEYQAATYTDANMVSGSVTPDFNDQVILLNAAAGAVNVQLPPVAGALQNIWVKAISVTNAVTLTPNGAETIEGAATFTFSEVNESVLLTPDASRWRLLSDYKPSGSGSGGSSATPESVVEITAATYTMPTSVDMLLVNAASNAVTITLPAKSAKATATRKSAVIKVINSTFAVTVVAAGTDQIDNTGQTTVVITDTRAVTFVGNTGSRWRTYQAAAPGGATAPGTAIPSGFRKVSSYVRTSATASPTTNSSFIYPLEVRGAAIPAIGVQLTTQGVGGSTLAKLAVFNDLNGLPDLASGPAQQFTLDVTQATGKIDITLTTPLAQGNYWVGWTYIVTTAPTTAPQYYCISGVSWSLPLPAAVAGINTTPCAWAWRSMTTSAPWPTDFTTAQAAAASECPTVYVKAA